MTNTKTSISRRIPTFQLIATVSEYQFIDNPMVKSNFYEKEFGFVNFTRSGKTKKGKKTIKQLIYDYYSKLYENRAHETFRNAQLYSYNICK